MFTNGSGGQALDYADFLKGKILISEPCGIDVEAAEINKILYPFQRKIVQWSVKVGRAALFEDCGLGKTFQQLEWARLVSRKSALVLVPLAVAYQTNKEAAKLGMEARICKDDSDVAPGINITNYQKLHHFDPDKFDAIVLDESSILKSFDGKTRKALSVFAERIPYRLCCTATPAPNDFIEITNHVEFLGIMSAKEVIALFFTQDGNTSHKFRLKRHAEGDFWKWMASWCVAIRKPSDLGFEDGGFSLPPLKYRNVEVSAELKRETLFDMGGLSLMERRRARKESLSERVSACAEIVNASPEAWIVWCDLNAEGDALTKAIPESVQIKGSDSSEHKERSLIGFSDGAIRVLITKPSIAGHGMNWQHCSKMAFVGLSDSYEQFYQAVRRCWRFGQKQQVDCYIITSSSENDVRSNIARKQKDADRMFAGLVRHMGRLNARIHEREIMKYEEGEWSGEGWRLMLGDSVVRTSEIEADSVGLSIFSPPFPGMYAYTNSPNDMGNVASVEQMIDHFHFLAEKILRVTMPGRSCCIHLTQSPMFKSRDGYVGLKDFRGLVIAMMQRSGWIYYGEVCIDKDPQVKAIRTKDRGLLFKTLAKDSSHMHMALADYLIQFRKPGESPEPIKSGISKRYGNDEGWITSEEWIEWAAPVWYRATDALPGGIRETDVLNVSAAREEKDERHLCPLQLGVIERAVKLWSNPGDIVFSPFAGIGSEGYQSILLKRRFVGIELKRSYAETAVKNLKKAEEAAYQPTLFDGLEEEATA